MAVKIKHLFITVDESRAVGEEVKYTILKRTICLRLLSLTCSPNELSSTRRVSCVRNNSEEADTFLMISLAQHICFVIIPTSACWSLTLDDG